MRINLNRRSLGAAAVVTSGVLFLSACALPPSVQIASWVADGVSFIATQKSLTDHGISLIARRDCALWRGIKGEAICRDPDVGTFAIAANNDTESAAKDEADAEETAAMTGFETAAGGAHQGEKTAGEISIMEKNAGELFAVPVRAAPWVTAVAPELREQGRLPKAPLAEQVAQSGLFYVIGSFTRSDFAGALAKRHAKLKARMVDVSVGSSRLYRVVVGPFNQGRQYYVFRRIAEAGINGAWATLMTLPAPRRMAGLTSNGGRPVRSLLPESAAVRKISKPLPVKPLPVKPLTVSALTPGLHYVIGSFADPVNAFGLAKRLAGLSPSVITRSNGSGVYRVVVGPFNSKDNQAGRRSIRNAGVPEAWPVYLDPSEWSIAGGRGAKTGRQLSEAPAAGSNIGRGIDG